MKNNLISIILLLLVSCNERITSKYSNGHVQSKIVKCNKPGCADTFVHFFENGNISVKANYHKGKYDGYYSDFFESGKLNHTGFYNQGRKEGIFIRYEENGGINLKEIYKNDSVAVRLVYRNGKPDYLIFKISNQKDSLISADRLSDSLIQHYFDSKL